MKGGNQRQEAGYWPPWAASEETWSVQLGSNLLHSFVRLNGTPQQVYTAGRREGVSFVLLSCVRAGDSLCTKSSKPRIQKHFFYSKALLHRFKHKMRDIA